MTYISIATRQKPMNLSINEKRMKFCNCFCMFFKSIVNVSQFSLIVTRKVKIIIVLIIIIFILLLYLYYYYIYIIIIFILLLYLYYY